MSRRWIGAANIALWGIASIGSVPAEPVLEAQAGVLLVAARSLSDPNFHRSVVLILEHDASGALGVVLNRPAGIGLGAVFSTAPAADPAWLDEIQVRIGGPVGPGRLFLLVAADRVPPDARTVIAGVHASGSMRALEWAAANVDPGAVRVYAGYAGWGPGQLDQELSQAGWHLAAATRADLFAPDTELWRSLIARTSGTWVRAEESHTVLQAREFRPMSGPWQRTGAP